MSSNKKTMKKKILENKKKISINLIRIEKKNQK